MYFTICFDSDTGVTPDLGVCPVLSSFKKMTLHYFWGVLDPLDVVRIKNCVHRPFNKGQGTEGEGDKKLFSYFYPRNLMNPSIKYPIAYKTLRPSSRKSELRLGFRLSL